jgi:hypothetical protein
MAPSTSSRQWGITWVCLVLAIALHVADEALTGFLPRYNAFIESLRAANFWLPFPTFTFQAWISGLTLGVLILLSLSPLVFAGNRYLRPLAFFLGILMVANALGHIGISVYLGEFAPGVYSSPVLLVAAVALLVTTWRHRCSSGTTR